MQPRAAADSEPAVSARKNATTPSPTWRPTSPPGVDHALVGRADEPAPEREVAGGGQPPGKRRGGLEIGEQDRRRSPAGLGQSLHPLEMARVARRGDRRQHRHARPGLGDQRGARAVALGVVDADSKRVTRRPAAPRWSPATRSAAQAHPLPAPARRRCRAGSGRRVRSAPPARQACRRAPARRRPLRTRAQAPAYSARSATEPGAAGLRTEVVRADRDRRQPQQATVDPALIVGAVDAAPLTIDDIRPLAGVTERDGGRC